MADEIERLPRPVSPELLERLDDIVDQIVPLVLEYEEVATEVMKQAGRVNYSPQFNGHFSEASARVERTATDQGKDPGVVAAVHQFLRDQTIISHLKPEKPE